MLSEFVGGSFTDASAKEDIGDVAVQLDLLLLPLMNLLFLPMITSRWLLLLLSIFRLWSHERC